GGESGETVRQSNRGGEYENTLNGNYEHDTEETENVDQSEEELMQLNGKINENGGGMEQMNSQDDLTHEEDVKEDYSDSQNQVESHLEKTSRNPRVTITSPQESEKKEQSNDCAVVA
ncbi:UNVERIFIED_CONTAM: hypothetical protein H355_005998, partial [Colinus virginianus]